MLQLRIFFVANVAFTCFFVENVVITRFLTLNFTQNFWKKFSEIRRILAKNLRKILAGGASGPDEWTLDFDDHPFRDIWQFVVFTINGGLSTWYNVQAKGSS